MQFLTQASALCKNDDPLETKVRTDQRADVIADVDGNAGRPGRDVFDGDSGLHVIGVVEGQNIGIRVAGFHGDHGFLL